ncbi:MAG: hypothetical protein SGPRY_000595, partial [Prymnesium sp.]
MNAQSKPNLWGPARRRDLPRHTKRAWLKLQCWRGYLLATSPITRPATVHIVTPSRSSDTLKDAPPTATPSSAPPHRPSRKPSRLPRSHSDGVRNKWPTPSSSASPLPSSDARYSRSRWSDPNISPSACRPCGLEDSAKSTPNMMPEEAP